MKKKILYLLPFAILLILFVPIKFQYRDGGTVDYRALMYRVIKWNKLNNDGTYYQANDVIIFPNNFHSIEYYEPVELPNIYVSIDNEESSELTNTNVSANDEETIELPNTYVLSNNKEIRSSSGSAHWSKVVDGKTISAIFDSIDPRDGNYKDGITINNQELINIKTDYKVSSVEIQNIDKENNEKYQVQYNAETKNISFKNIENGIYVVTYKIENNADYAYYSFKVVIHN